MIDGRMESDRLGPGSGVYTYYRMLRTIGETFPDFSVLTDCLSEGTAHERAWTPAVRLIRAVVRSEANLTAESPPFDVFRLAHVRFRMTGRLSRIALSGPPGIIHWTYPVPLWIQGWRNIYTVHDTLQLEPGGLRGRARARHIALLQAVRSKADSIVTVSDHSRNELERHLGWNAEGIVNASVAAAPPLVAPDAGPRANGPILVLGTNGPRKNIEFLLEAYSRSGIDRPLIVAGPANRYVEGVMTKFGHVPGVSFRTNLTDVEVSALLGQARCLAFPTLAEGFGLPIIEAMTHRCPVVHARLGAMQEAAGTAGLGFTPGDQAELIAHLCAIDRDDRLVKSLQDAGEIRARDFSVQRLRARLCSLYGM